MTDAERVKIVKGRVAFELPPYLSNDLVTAADRAKLNAKNGGINALYFTHDGRDERSGGVKALYDQSHGKGFQHRQHYLLQ